jgi:hypothetical protein
MFRKAQFSHVYLILYFQIYSAPALPGRTIMSLQHSLRLQELQIEAINIQREHLLVVQHRHTNWISDDDDANINGLCLELIHSIGKTLAQYENLLNALRERE